MLTDKQLEAIAGALKPLFDEMEHEVIVEVAARIKNTLSFTRTTQLEVQALQELGYSPNKLRHEAMKKIKADKEFRRKVAENTLKFKRKVLKLLDGIRNKAYREGDRLLLGAGEMAYNNDLSLWRSEGKDLKDNTYLPNIVDAIKAQTSGELKNLSRTTGFKGMNGYESIGHLYQSELDKALVKIAGGTRTVDEAVAEVVKELAKSGLRTINFASGRSMQLDTAVSLALRTASHQLAARITDENIRRTGVELVYVSKHWGARNKGSGVQNHEEWQGKVYSISGDRNEKEYQEEARRVGQTAITDLWEATGYSVNGSRKNNPLGLNGYNCRHTLSPWWLGDSSKPKEDPQPEPRQYKGRVYDYYEATQKQRKMEREVRALRREQEALAKLGMNTDDVKRRIKARRAEYKEFSEACGLKQYYNRMAYYSNSGDLNKTKAWQRYATELKESQASVEQPASETPKVGKTHEPSEKSVAKKEQDDIVELTHEELGAVTKYKGFDSYGINAALRSESDISKLSARDQEFVKNLDSALQKMPRYEGDLFRMVDFSDYPDKEERLEEFVKLFVKGETITTQSYWSTSKEEGYNDEAQVRMRIERTSKGKDISKIGVDEKEVLYERATSFTVTDKTFNGICWMIVLKEA